MAKYWFSAKTPGWGWGHPVGWQGWVVVIVFGALVAAGGILLPPRQHLVLYLGYIASLTILLIGIGWVTKEPGRRQNDDDGDG